LSPSPVVNDSLTIIIPAFNEERSIVNVLAEIRESALGAHARIVVVDDGSTDRTAAVAGDHGAVVLRHPRNIGYGAALKTGIRHAETTFIATMDGDGQHSADALVALWDGRANTDMIVGARSGLRHSRPWRMPGKWLISAMAAYLSGQKIPDLNSGLRLYRRDVLTRYLHLCPLGFSFTTTITLALLIRGWRVEFLPIAIRRRQDGRSTVNVATGLRTIVLVLRIISLFHPVRVFVPAAVVLVVLGVLWAIPYAASGQGISVGSMLAIVTGVILFALGLLCDQVSQLRLERFE
jgi:glycosyltransferase involved in cell wall biosynthesis